jgi:hypothetical protein
MTNYPTPYTRTYWKFFLDERSKGREYALKNLEKISEQDSQSIEDNF